MPSGQDGPDSPVSLGLRPGLSHDGRQELGYGTTKEKFHSPREKGSNFPYSEPAQDESEEIEELEITDELMTKIINRIATPYKSSDALIRRSIDKDSYANGNRPIAIGEGSGKSLVPFPGMYKKRMQVGGGVNSPKLVAPGQYNRTGTTRGWSHAPIPLDPAQDKEAVLTPDEEGLQKIRDIVRMVLDSSSKEV